MDEEQARGDEADMEAKVGIPYADLLQVVE